MFPKWNSQGTVPYHLSQNNINLPQSSTPRSRAPDSEWTIHWLTSDLWQSLKRKYELGLLFFAWRLFFFLWERRLWEYTQSVNRQAERTRKLMPPKAVLNQRWMGSWQVCYSVVPHLENWGMFHNTPRVPQEGWILVAESGAWPDKALHVGSLPFFPSLPHLLLVFPGSPPK